MPKNIFQDMVKINSTRRDPSLDISRPRQEIKPREMPPVRPRPPARYSTVNPEPVRPSRYGLWIVAGISVLFLFFALSFLFGKAKIVVHPRTSNITLAESLSAIKDGAADNLSFDLVAMSGEETKVVKGGEEQDLSASATGSVVIYNTFSSAPQSLDINTRLEGSNGKIYKTDVKVVVPGMRPDSTPGSVEVGIHASEPGEAYNSVPLDFKIIGFKGTSKYEKFYARPKGGISGGIQGRYHTISAEEKGRVESELEASLREKLLKKVTDQIPEGFILFKDAILLRIDETSSGAVSLTQDVTVRTKGTLYGFLFNEKELTAKLVKNRLSNYDGSPVHIPNLRDLVFSLFDPNNTSFKDASVISFSLTGNAKVIYEVDTDKLRKDVLVKKKKDFNRILLGYPNIDSADLMLRPIWKSSFPEDESDIKISVEPI